MNGRLTRDRLFIRLANDGTPIANSAIWRKHIPVGQGRWKDITSCVIGCCDPQNSSIVFQGLTPLDGDSLLTNISFPGYSWSGELGQGDFLVVPLPFNFAETITLTVEVIDTAMAINTSTVQGDGVIAGDTTVATDADPQTVELTVTSTPGSQYLVILTDD